MPKKLTQKQFLERLREVHGDTITTDDVYVNAKTKIKFRCNMCSYTWKATPDSTLHHGCPECKRKLISNSKRKTTDKLNDELESMNITTKDQYTKCKGKMVFNCTICGHSWKSNPSSILAGRSKCRICHKHALRKPEDKFIKQVCAIWGKKLQIIGEYQTSLSPVKTRCNLCGHIWYPIASNILRGRGCPNCHTYTGEQLVSSILNFNSINYDPQHDFKIKGKTHRLDFVLKDNDNNWCVIQPDGEQHFKPVSHFGGEKQFKHRKQMDKDENKYLPLLGIRVLRIPWFWFDLDNTFILLQDFLGYSLKKPDRDYVPKYRKLTEMSNCYKYHRASYVSSKYGVSSQYVVRAFKLCFNMSKRDYIKINPSLSNQSTTDYVKSKSIKVVSINSKGITQQYNSINEASRKINGSASGISECLHNKLKTSGGYKWEYAE